MEVHLSSMETLISTLFSSTQFGHHSARLKSMSQLLCGLLKTQESGLSGMARGSALLDPTTNFRAKLKQAYYLIQNPYFDPWEIAQSLYVQLTQELSQVLIAVDWTQVGKYWVLEASLVVEGRAIGFYCRSILKAELQGRQRVLEQSMEYALESFRLPHQQIHLVVDRGFASFDYLGPSELYPHLHRISRLKSNMILNWDGIEGPLGEWPLYEGESVLIQKAKLGRRKTVLCSVIWAAFPNQSYFACDPQSLEVALQAYQKRVWVEEQNRDLKTRFAANKMRFLNSVRLERMWGLLGIAFAIIYTQSQKVAKQLDRLSRKYKDGRKELAWVTLVQYCNQTVPFKPDILKLKQQ